MTENNEEASTRRQRQVELLQEINNRTIRLEVELKQLQENEGRYVTRAEFEPIQRLVFGATAIVLIGVVGAVLALVVQ